MKAFFRQFVGHQLGKLLVDGDHFVRGTSERAERIDG
jgi:hypothetical protein